ncbi:unnamed protein product [Prorocentrum cordatum]|uniref:C3H1-type domain-containing protein n=1 Tax=Prorocentrum cordatum TaxID=2364126 RepID=A0ABN9W984_9DINO|nr:unnamed protein product [Polarella glacialis]
MDGAILVAPILDEESEHQVYLPNGSWYELFTNKVKKGPTERRGNSGLDEIPAYVRPGTIVTLGPVIQHMGELPGGALKVHVYAGADAEFELVEDDGDTYLYKDGEVRNTLFKWDNAAGELSWKASVRSAIRAHCARERGTAPACPVKYRESVLLHDVLFGTHTKSARLRLVNIPRLGNLADPPAVQAVVAPCNLGLVPKPAQWVVQPRYSLEVEGGVYARGGVGVRELDDVVARLDVRAPCSAGMLRSIPLRRQDACDMTILGLATSRSLTVAPDNMKTRVAESLRRPISHHHGHASTKGRGALDRLVRQRVWQRVRQPVWQPFRLRVIFALPPGWPAEWAGIAFQGPRWYVLRRRHGGHVLRPGGAGGEAGAPACPEQQMGGDTATKGKSKGKGSGGKLISSSLPCKYFGSAKGCNFGDDCAYKHNNPNSVAPCKNFASPEGCKHGDKCFYRHTDLEIPQEKVKGKGKGAAES